MDLAKVGFAADTSPLKDLTTAIDNTKTSAQNLNAELAKTKPAADQASAGVSQVADSATKASAALDKTATTVQQTASKTADLAQKLGQLPDGTAKAVQAAEQLAASLVKIGNEGGKTASVSQQLEQIVSKTGVSYAQASQALQGAIAAHNAASTATASHAKSAETLAGAASGAIPPIVNLGQAAGAAGSGLSGLGATARGLGLDVAGVAAGIGAAAVAIQKAGDEVVRQQSRFTSITGSVKEGAAAYNLIRQSAKDAGVDFASLSSAIEKAQQGTDKMSNSWPVIRLGASQASTDIRSLTDMFTTLNKVMQIAGATSQEEAQVQATLAQGIQQNGGLTLDTFQKIRDVMPQVARAISSGFGFQDINQFQKQLALTPKSLTDLETAIAGIKPKVDAAFDPNAPKTFEQSIRDIKNEWQSLLTTLSQDGAFNFVTSQLSKFNQSLDATIKEIQTLIGWYNQLSAAAATGGPTAARDLAGAGAFGNSSDAAGLNTAPAAPATTTSGNGFNFSQMSSSDYSFDNSSFISDSVANSFIGNFADGGSFVVPGSGGTDSFSASMNLTPGEIVDIHPPGSLTGVGDGATQTPADMSPGGDPSGIKAATDVLAANIDQDLKTQTAALTERINASTASITAAVNSAASSITAGLKTATATTPAKAPTSAGGTTSATSSSTSLGSSAGGLGGVTGVTWPTDDWFATDDQKKKSSGSSQSQSQQQAPALSAAQAIQAALAGMGVSQGQARGVRGYQGSFPVSGSGLDPFTGQPGLSSATDPQSLRDAAVSGLDNVYTKDQFNSNMNDQVAALKRDFDSQAALNQNIADQNGGLKTPRDYGSPTGVSTNYPPAVLGHYDDNMAFVPNNPSKVGPGMTPLTNDYTFAGQTNPLPYQPGISTPLSFPKYYNDLKNGAIDKVPLPQPRPPEADQAAKQDLDQQTNALKQAQDNGSKSISDQVKSNADQSKAIGDKTNTSLGDISKFSNDQLQSLDAVDQSTRDSTDATQAGTDATKEGTSATQDGFKTTADGLSGVKDVGSQANDSIGKTTDAVSSGSSSIVDAVNSLGSALSNAASNAAASGARGFGSDVSGTSGLSGFSSGSSSGSGDISSDGMPSSGFGGDSGYTPPPIDSPPIDYASQLAAGELALATGGQFTVKGPGHTDTEKVEFWASPGEVVTVTPPGGTPPPNPTFGSAPQTKNGARAFAAGGQITLGGEFGTPSLSQTSADLISAHVAAKLNDQSAALGDKIDAVGQTIADAVSASTDSIRSSIGALSNAIPAVGGATATTSVATGPDPVALAAAKQAALQNMLAATGPSTIAVPATSGITTTAALGGVTPSFANGGQLAVSSDVTGSTASIGTDTLSSGLAAKSDQQTAGVKAKLDAMGNRIIAAVNSDSGVIITGINGVKDQFNAWRSSVNISDKSSSSSSSSASGVSNGTTGGFFSPFGVNGISVNAVLDNSNLSGGAFGLASSGGVSVNNPLGKLGAYATGGQFVVTHGMADGGVLTVPGGSSGTDSVDVAVKAAPGEKIFVMQPEDAERLKQSQNIQHVTPEPLKNYLGDSAAIPGSSGSLGTGQSSGNAPVAANSNGAWGQGAGGSPITIIVQDKVQADDFIRSRAQIQRAMRG
ncbi:tape measure protein [Bradyrhizobium sp. USDA 4473]